MRNTFRKVEFSTLPETMGGKSNSKTPKVALLPYDEVISFLKHNYNLPINSKERVTDIEVMGYKVSLNGFKLRTFAHYDEQNKPCCNNPDCQLKPAYFALELPKGHKRQYYSVAYLSLYGLDKDNNEVEFTHDHTLARCFGGANTLANITMMCYPCNNQKSRIESRLHHRTLRILKEFLDDSTGQDTNPQFLLERVRNSDLNFSQPEQVFEREGIIPVNEVLEVIRDPNRTNNTWFDRKVKTSGVRLEAFSSGPCCQNSECALPATHFAVERVADKQMYINHGFHLNMYGKTPDGREVQFMHHHLLRPGADGVPESFAIVSLCSDCKNECLTKDNSHIANHLTSLGGALKQVPSLNKEQPIGITRMDLEKFPVDRKYNRILEAVQDLAAHSSKTVNEYIDHCNTTAVHKGILNSLNAKHSGVRRVIQAFPALTPAGARWFRKEQREFYSENNTDRNSVELSEKDIRNTPVNVTRVRKIMHQAEHLATSNNLSLKDYLAYCETRAQLTNEDNNLTSKMNKLRQIVAVLEISPQAGRIFIQDVVSSMKKDSDFDLNEDFAVESISLQEHIERQREQCVTVDNIKRNRVY